MQHSRLENLWLPVGSKWGSIGTVCAVFLALSAINGKLKLLSREE